jgi:ABC-type xylose transport system permease subunit
MYPTAAAFVTSNFSIGRTLQAVGVREEAAPMVDRLTGVAVMRLITTLNASLKHNRLTVGAVGSGTNSLGSTKQPQTLRYVLALNEFVQYQLVRSWSFELGARQSLFSFSNTPESPMLWSVYFAVSYATGIIPF